MSAGAQPPPELAGRGERGGLRLRAAAMLVLLGVLLHGPQLAGPFTDGLSGDCGAMFSVMARNTERLGWRGLCPAINTAPPEPGELVDHYNHHPPGLPWMVFLATRLPVQAETAARLVALLLTLATVLLLADLATRLSGPAAGGAAGLLALLAPAGWHHGLLVNYETAALPPMLLLVRALVLQRGPTALAAAWGALSDWIAVAPLLLVRGVTWRRRVPAALAAGAVLAGSFVLGRLFAPGSPGETLAQARLASFLNPAFDGGAWVANVGRFLAALFGCALLPAACALLVWPRRAGPLRSVLGVLLAVGLANVAVFAFHATSHETYVLLLLPYVVLSTATLLFPADAPPGRLPLIALVLLLAAGSVQALAALPERARTSQAELGDAFRAVTVEDAIYLHPQGVPFTFLHRAGRRVAPPWGVVDLPSAVVRVQDWRQRLGRPSLPGFVFTHEGEPAPDWVAALGPGESRGGFLFRALP